MRLSRFCARRFPPPPRKSACPISARNPTTESATISAIRKAFAYAVANKATTVRFDAGVYDLNIGDATRDIFEIDGAENLSIVGAVGSDGEPKTVFLRRYKPERNLFGGKILKVLRSPNLSVRGIAFDNFPRYMSCGEIVANDGRGITVKVFEGNPYLDGHIRLLLQPVGRENGKPRGRQTEHDFRHRR